jgi:outer membrane protein TolC
MKTINFLVILFLFQKNVMGKDILAEMIQEGIRHNISIKNQKINLEKAKIDLSTNKKANLPKISLSSGLSYSHTAGTGTLTESASLSTEWNIWDHWEAQTNIVTSKISLKNAELETFKSIQEYILNLLDSFFKLQLLKNKKMITNESLKSAQMNYDKAIQLVEMGAKTKMDAYTPEISLLNTKRDLLEINNQIQIDQTALKFLINPNKDTLIPTIDFLTFEPYFQKLFEKKWENLQKDWDKKILKTNPSIRITSNDMEKSKRQLAQEKLNHWPKISVSASHAWDLAEQFKGGNAQSLTAAVNLSWTVFDWGVSKSSLQSTIYDLQISELNFKKAIFEKKNTILSLFQKYKILAQTIKASQLILKKAEDQQEYSKQVYSLGKITSFELKQSITDLYRAKDSLASRLKEKFNLMGKILFAFGQDLRPQS